MSTTLRAAVIGLGRMGSTIDEEPPGGFSRGVPHAHTACYRAARVPVVAGADGFEEQREAYRRKWGVEAVYADYREMVERERPDIISVATSATPRARIVQDVVEIGARRGLKAIWAEKPISISLEEADQMVEACRRAGIVFAVGCSRNWHPAFTRTRQLIDGGEIGTLLQVIALGTSSLSANGSHLLAALNYLAGSWVQWVFGHLTSDERAATDEDQPANGYFQYENGVHGFVRAMESGVIDMEYEVLGTDGFIRVTIDGTEIELWKTGRTVLGNREPKVARHIVPPVWPVESPNLGTVRDLLVCIETGKSPNCSGDDARHALEVGIAMRESHRRGGTRVHLPLADRSLRVISGDSIGDDTPKAVRRARTAARTGS
jgi:predicted dehydrogenase